MPVSYDIDLDASFVILRFTGETDFAAYRAVMDGVLADPRFRPGMCWLSDRRATTELPSADFVRRLTDYIGTHSPTFARCGWAVVTGTLGDYGMARMAELLSERHEADVRAFMDYDEAVAWLHARQGKPSDGSGSPSAA